GQARPDIRGVRAGRREQHPGPRRDRSGACHRQAPGAPDGRGHHRRERPWRRLDLHTHPPAALRGAGVKTILLVEDVALNRELLVQLLGERYRLVLAEDGADALARAAETRPDLILMDLTLPRMDGWEATRRLKGDAALAGIPVVAVSARAMRGDEERP